MNICCKLTDQPVAALLHDLKQRGLLEETLVIWGGEFGRTPMMLISSRSAFKLSAFQRFQPLTAMHLRRQLLHLPLKAIQWANITHGFVTLSTILK